MATKSTSKPAAETKAASENTKPEASGEATNAPTDAEHETPAVSIRSRAASFRRCGYGFSSEETVFSAGTFTIEELQRLAGEPELLVKPAPEPE